MSIIEAMLTGLPVVATNIRGPREQVVDGETGLLVPPRQAAPLAAGLTRLMTSLLFHVSSLDPVTYCAVTAILIATAMLASYLPSRRAATIDPVETLRAE